jgi:hypothetical protein
MKKKIKNIFWDDYTDMISGFSLLLILVLTTVGVLFLSNKMAEKQCSNNVTEMGRNYRYDFINGCRIQLKDGTFVYWKMFSEFSQD